MEMTADQKRIAKIALMSFMKAANIVAEKGIQNLVPLLLDAEQRTTQLTKMGCLALFYMESIEPDEQAALEQAASALGNIYDKDVADYLKQMGN